MSKMTLRGIHLLVDLVNLSNECCCDGEKWINTLKKAALKINVKIISSSYHIFNEPDKPGITAFVQLDTSHFSVHTYADEGIGALDLFICSNRNLNAVLDIIMKEFCLKKNNIGFKKEISRFSRIPH